MTGEPGRFMLGMAEWFSDQPSGASVRGTGRRDPVGKKEFLAMRRIQCAWCLRLKGPGGHPIGPVLPVESFTSHGICADCARRRLAIPADALSLRASRRSGHLIRRRRYSAPGAVERPRPALTRPDDAGKSSAGSVREQARVGVAEVERRARIVVGPGLLELQTDDGSALRTIIFERSSPQSKDKARDMLTGEARALGYVLVGECEELARSPGR